MSYDYNALVTKIAFHRRQAWDSTTKQSEEKAKESIQSNLQQSVDTFQELSSNCPMTPLLWIQYAADTKKLIQCLSENDNDDNDAAAIEMQLEILQLGILEFPGCALLRLHYLEILISQQQHEKNVQEKIENAFQDAFQYVGQGSHRNEDDLIATIYKLYVDYYAAGKASKQYPHQKVKEEEEEDNTQQCFQIFYQRSKVPMKDANNGLGDELQQFCQQYCNNKNNNTNNDAWLQKIEHGRRMVSKVYSSLITWEDDIDVAMHEEGILTRHVLDHSNIDWDTLLYKTDCLTAKVWNGLGGLKSSKAFCKYAQSCARYTLDENINLDDYEYNGTSTEEEATTAAEEHHQQQLRKDKEQSIHDLALCVYERGAAECPTVEALWLSYIKHLHYLHSQQQEKGEAVLSSALATTLRNRIESVTDRAIRNCPYSLRLYQEKLKSFGILAKAGEIVLDPDKIMELVQKATNSMFLPTPQAYIDIYMSGITTLKRHILSLISSKATTMTTPPKVYNFDDAEMIPKPPKNTRATNNGNQQQEQLYHDLDDHVKEEVQDLIEDLHDFYDAAFTNLKKNDKIEQKEQLSVIWYDRAMTETYLLSPLMTSLENDHDDDQDKYSNRSKMSETTAIFEKLVRLYSPPHPDNYLEYIRYVMSSSTGTATPGEIVARLRKVRGLYQKALMSMKKYKQKVAASVEEQQQQQTIGESPPTIYQRDHETSLHNLCHEYLRFEQTFGSEQSFIDASKNIQKKLYGNKVPTISTTATTVSLHPPLVASPLPIVAATASKNSSDSQVKRKLSVDQGENSSQPISKKQKVSMDKDNSDETMIDATQQHALKEKAVNLKVEKKHPEYKVHIGNLDYPAHPFTVRVSNLSLDTKDMELVELFKSKNCGPIVHARIFRDKLQHGKPKGQGLVQFEERESVEKALALNEEVGLHEKLIKVERSHMPAVSLVPPGMHNVNPQGHGKSTKRNQKRKSKSKNSKAGDNNNTKKNHLDTTGEGAETVTQSKDITSYDEKGREKSTVDSSSILAFRPRGLAHGPGHRKVKLSAGLSNSSKK